MKQEYEIGKHDNESYDIFLAYPRKDYCAAKKLARIIQSNGFSVWCDMTNLLIGESFENAIYDAIRNSKLFVALFSTWALNSKWLQREIEIAQNFNIPVIKVLTDNPEGLTGTRRMSFGSILEMESPRFEEKLLSSILRCGGESVVNGMFAKGKELHNEALESQNVQKEENAFVILLRAAEFGNSDARLFIESQTWNINLGKAVAQYVPFNNCFIEDLRADLYRRGEIIADDETVSDNSQRGKVWKKQPSV